MCDVQRDTQHRKVGTARQQNNTTASLDSTGEGVSEAENCSTGGEGARREAQRGRVSCFAKWGMLAEARKLSTSREILLWMTPSEAPKALQASECSELLDPMRANCWIFAQH